MSHITSEIPSRWSVMKSRIFLSLGMQMKNMKMTSIANVYRAQYGHMSLLRRMCSIIAKFRFQFNANLTNTWGNFITLGEINNLNLP